MYKCYKLFLFQFDWDIIDMSVWVQHNDLSFLVLQLLSHVSLSVILWTATGQAPLSSTVSWSLLIFPSIESVSLSSYLILCSPFLLPSVFPNITVFSSESALHTKWPKNWSFSTSPSSEYSGFLWIDWFDLLAVQGTLKSLLQHLGSKASILRHSAFFIAQFSHPYMTNWKNHSFDYMDLCWQNDGSVL